MDSSGIRHREMAHAYQNKYDGWVAGSNFNEQSASAIIGLNKNGAMHLHTGIYHLNVGLTEKTALPVHLFYRWRSTTMRRTFSSTENDLKVITYPLPWQQIDHYKAALNSSILLGDGAIDAIIGWQQKLGRIWYTLSWWPRTYFKMNTVNYDLRYNLPAKITGILPAL